MNTLPNGCPRCGRHDAQADGALVYCIRCGIFDSPNADDPDDPPATGVDVRTRAREAAPRLARYWREGFGQWTAELWTVALESDPPEPEHPMHHPEQPAPVAGHRLRAVELAWTERGARRACERLLAVGLLEPPPPSVRYVYPTRLAVKKRGVTEEPVE